MTRWIWGNGSQCIKKKKSIWQENTHKTGEVKFLKGQLVQIYRSDLDFTFKTEWKLLPKWSKPYWDVTRNVNANTLKTLEGEPVMGIFSTRCLRRFTSLEGLEWVEKEKEIEKHVLMKKKKRRGRRKKRWKPKGQRTTKNQSNKGKVGVASKKGGTWSMGFGPTPIHISEASHMTSCDSQLYKPLADL